jgi:hypothetical protein
MIGTAYSTGGNVQVLATYNVSEIVNGPVTTTVTDVIPKAGELPRPASDELVLFETTTDITGQIPVTISVTGGTLFFKHFWMNYSGVAREFQARDPNVPVNPQDPSTYVVIVTVYPDSYYGDPNNNSIETDGISNLTKNAQPWTWRVNVDGRLGDWTYPIAAGETVTFDFFVDPAHVVLGIPD